MTTHRPVGALDLHEFTLHCWRHGARASVDDILTRLAPVSPYGHIPGLRMAVRSLLIDVTGRREWEITGQEFARSVDPSRFRPCSGEDIIEASMLAMAAPRFDALASTIAGLAASCELGSTAIAGAWAYGALTGSPSRSDGALISTGLPVPADDIGVLLAQSSPQSRRPVSIDEWIDLVASSNLTTQNTVLLSFAAVARWGGSDQEMRDQMAAQLENDLLPRVPWVAPKVMQMLRATYGQRVACLRAT